MAAPAQTFTMFNSSQSHRIPAQALPDLSQLFHEVASIAKDRNRARPQRDLAKSALALANRFDEKDGLQKRVIADVLSLAFLAAASGDENKVSGIRDEFEEFAEDAKVSAQTVHDYTGPLMKEFGRAIRKPNPTNHRAEEIPSMQEQNLRAQVTVVKGDKTADRPSRDLAKSAIKLVDALVGSGLSEIRVLALHLTWETIRSKALVNETREVFEDLLDDELEGGNFVNAVHAELVKLQQKRSAGPVQVDVPKRSSGSSRVSSSRHAGRSSPVNSSNMGIRHEKIGGKTTVHTDAKDGENRGYKFRFAAHRETALPANLSDLVIVESSVGELIDELRDV